MPPPALSKDSTLATADDITTVLNHSTKVTCGDTAPTDNLYDGDIWINAGNFKRYDGTNWSSVPIDADTVVDYTDSNWRIHFGFATNSLTSTQYLIGAYSNGKDAYFKDIKPENVTVGRATSDADGNNISSSYVKIGNVAGKGSSLNPVYFDSDGNVQTSPLNMINPIGNGLLGIDCCSDTYISLISNARKINGGVTFAAFAIGCENLPTSTSAYSIINFGWDAYYYDGVELAISHDDNPKRIYLRWMSDMTKWYPVANMSDIPTVNDAKLTIQTEGTEKGAFTANSASDVTINIKASDLGLAPDTYATKTEVSAKLDKSSMYVSGTTLYINNQ